MSWVITGSEKTPVDPQFGSVSLLLHGDGANGSTTIIDSSPSPKTITRVGDTQISTAQSKFGGSSILFDGTGDYLTTPITSNLQFGTGDFTIEGWFYVTSDNTRSLFSLNTFSNGILLRRRTAGFGTDTFYINGTAYTLGSALPPLNTWQHVALTRASGVVNVFFNGVTNLTVTNTASISPTGSLFVGTAGHALGETYFGYIDDFRITKGIARYTANFTPPTAPFPDI
jgi:hypothetical protein